MPLPNREGRFQAYAARHALRYVGQNKLPTLVAEYQVLNELQGDGSWADVSVEQFQISGFHYLQKLDGQLNTVTIDQLRRAWPQWDGRDLAALEAADLSQTLVQITVGIETFNGKTSPKVNWLSAADDDSQGGLAVKDPKAAREIASTLGAKLRAHAGGTQMKGAPPQGRPVPPGRPAAQKPTPAAPKPPAKPASPAPAPAPSPPKPASSQEASVLAWNTFAEACPPAWKPEDAENEFWRIVGEMFPGRSLNDFNALTVDEWLKVQVEATGKIIPFDQKQ